MQTEVERKLEQTKFNLRNYERKVWNAVHTLDSNRSELKAMISEGETSGRIILQEECCKYWQHEIDKLHGLIFKVCLKTGLTGGWS